MTSLKLIQQTCTVLAQSGEVALLQVQETNTQVCAHVFSSERKCNQHQVGGVISRAGCVFDRCDKDLLSARVHESWKDGWRA